MIDRVDGAESARWDHTASILALLANVHRRPGTPPIEPSKLHPYRQRRRRREVPMEEAKEIIEAVRRSMASG